MRQSRPPSRPVVPHIIAAFAFFTLMASAQVMARDLKSLAANSPETEVTTPILEPMPTRVLDLDP